MTSASEPTQSQNIIYSPTQLGSMPCSHAFALCFFVSVFTLIKKKNRKMMAESWRLVLVLILLTKASQMDKAEVDFAGTIII